jgi:hypothetical protein
MEEICRFVILIATTMAETLIVMAMAGTLIVATMAKTSPLKTRRSYLVLLKIMFGAAAFGKRLQIDAPKTAPPITIPHSADRVLMQYAVQGRY